MRWPWLCLAIVLAFPPAQAVTVISGPSLTMNPNGTTPLAGRVTLETVEPVGVELSITDGVDRWTVSFPEALQLHVIPVLGLKSNRTYTVDASLLPGGPVGTMFTTTPALPEHFPVLHANVTDPQKMEPGYTLIDCFNRRAGDSRPRYMIIVDNAGEVVWYSNECWSGVRQSPTGRIYARINEALASMDMLGNAQALHLQGPGLGLHHDVEITPDGTILSPTARTVVIPNFPTSASDPNAPTQTASVRDEGVVENRL